MRLPRGMVGSAAGLVVLGVGLTVVAGPLYGYTERAAGDLRARAPYVDAVLPDGGRGAGISDQASREAAAGVGP